MDVEKLINGNKTLVGYDQKEIKEEILRLQASYADKKKEVQNKLVEIKAENDELKRKLNLVTKSSPLDDAMDEVTSLIKTEFFEDTRTIYELKYELEKAEKLMEEKIRQKRLEKENAMERIEKARGFLLNLKEESSINKKGQGHNEK